LLGIIVGQVILYGPSLVGRKVLLPLDVLAGPGIYIPRTPAIEKIEQRDWSRVDLIYFEPMRRFAAQEMRAGRLPLWTPHIFAGSPYLGPKFSPFGLLETLTPSPVILAWSQFVASIVAGLGAYVFFRRALGVSFWPAAICAWCYPLTGFFIFWQGFVMSRMVTWLPWLLLAVDKTARDRRGWAPLGLSAATCVVVLGGQLDVAGQMLLGSGIYGLGRLWETWREDGVKPARVAFAKLAISWAIGLLLAAPTILPLLEHARTGSRMALRAAGTEERPPVGLAALPQAVVPEMYGSSETGSYPIFPKGQGNLQESSAAAYAGVLATLFAAPLALFSRKHRRLNWVWVALAGLGLGWCLNVPGVVQILRLPGLNMMSHNRFVFLTCFALLALAATGLEILRDPGFQWRPWGWFPALVLVGLCGWCVFRVWVPLEPVHHELEAMVRRGIDTGEWVHDLDGVRRAKEWFIQHYAMAAAWCGLGLGGWCLLRARKLGKQGLMFGAGTLMIAELFSFAHGHTVQSDPALYFPRIPVLEQVAKAAASGRVIGYDCLPANLTAFCGFNDVRGYDAVDPRRYLELLAPATDPKSKTYEYALTQWLIPKAAPTPDGGIRLYPIFDLLGVRFVIFSGSIRSDAHPIFQGDGYWVMENRGALPRAFVPRRVEFEPNASVRLQKLGAPDFDPRAAAYVESPVTLPDRCEGTVAIAEEIPTRVTISLQMATPGLVVLADLFDDGWQAYLNGKPVSILRTNHALCGVVVPAGRGSLEFRYRPASLKLGLSFAALGAVLLLSFAWWLKARAH
jgi:hypothetical protein